MLRQVWFKIFFENGYKKQILGIIALFLCIRLIIIFFGSSQFFCESELYRGTIAHEILTNKGWPIWAYQNEPHTGGSLIASLLIIPFFVLFPENLITVKIVALLLSLLTLLCVYYFTYHCLNKPQVAFLTLLWFTFAPPMYLVHSTILMGEHYESQLFVFISFILFYKMTNPQISSIKKFVLTALLGGICGFSLYFSYTFLIALITCLLAWFFIDKLFFLRRNFLAFLICAIIGFIPHFLYNHALKFSGGTIYGKSVFDHINVSYSALAERLHFLLTFYWPHGLWQGDLADIERFPALGAILGGVFMIAFFVVFTEKRKVITDARQFLDHRAWVLVLIYPIVFIALNAFSDFPDYLKFPPGEYAVIDDYTEFKYVLVLFPFIFIIISSFLLHINRENRYHPFIKQVVPIFICVLFWSISIFYVFKLTAIRNFDLHVRRWRPYSYHLMGEHVSRSFVQSSLKGKNEYIEKIRVPYRKTAYIGFAYQLANEEINRGMLREALTLIKRDFQRYFVVGLGIVCAEHIVYERNSLKDCCPFAEDIPINFHSDFVEGLGIGLGIYLEGPFDLRLSESDLSAYYRGFAIGRLRLFRYDLDNVFKEMVNVPLRYRADFYAGLNKYSDYLIDFEIDKEKLKGWGFLDGKIRP